jgi:uncharacterized protein
VDLDSVTMVTLRRGPRAGDFTDQELEELQQRHLAYLEDLRRGGQLVAAGPFSDQPDPTMRGLCLYVTDPQATRRLAEADPSVRAGRLRVDILRWSFQRGDVLLPRRGDLRSTMLIELFGRPTPGPGNSDGGDLELP